MPPSKDAAFDPYHKWLGIPRGQRPVTHYQLLGISPDETDAEVIEDAAIRQSAHVRTYQLGPNADACQRVLNEIAQAKRIVLDPAKRQEYDATILAVKPAAASKAAPPVRRSRDRDSGRDSGRDSRPSRSGQSGSRTILIIAACAGVVCLLIAIGVIVAMMSSTDDQKSIAKNDKKTDLKKPPVAKVEAKVENKGDPKTDTKLHPKADSKTPDADPKRIEKKVDGIVVEELIWRNDLPADRNVGRRDSMLGVFAGASGRLGGGGEITYLNATQEGNWIFHGQGVAGYHAYALAVKGLPAGWFTVETRELNPFIETGPSFQPKPPVEIIPEEEGVCYLSGVKGNFAGGEAVRVSRAKGKWLLNTSSAGRDIGAWAVICRFGKAADREKIRISEVEWSPRQGAIKLLDEKEGFCALTGIRGNIEDWGQQVHLTVKDGAWWLEGRDARGSLQVHALRVSITGKLPAVEGDKEIVLGKAETPKADPRIDPKTDPKTEPKVEAKKDPQPKIRRPVPDAAVVAVKQKELRSLVKALSPKADVDEVNKQAENLLGLGLAAKDDEAMRFAMLREAFDLTYPLGDLTLARRVLDALEEFDVNRLSLQAIALSKTAAKGPEACRVVAEVSDDFVKEAIDADDLDRAEKVASLGHTSAQQTKLPGRIAIAARRWAQARELKKELESYKAAQETLKTNPTDEKANGEAGAYLALGKGDWSEGLRLLAKGPAGNLKTAAEKDLARPMDTEEILALADAWADVIEKEPLSAYKSSAAWRAANSYRQVVADVPGPTRLKIEKRMADIEKVIPVPVTLPTHRWTFDGSLRDSIGEMTLTMNKTPTAPSAFVQGRLRCLPQQSYYRTNLTEDWGERTFEIWFYLAATNHRDVPIMRSATPDFSSWDGISFNNERVGEWYHGSSSRHRSRNIPGGNESAKPNEIIHMAVAYGKDNSITLFRNGKVLDGPFLPEGDNGRLITYRGGKDQLLFMGSVLTDVEEARVYNRALTPAEVATSFRTFKK